MIFICIYTFSNEQCNFLLMRRAIPPQIPYTSQRTILYLTMCNQPSPLPHPSHFLPFPRPFTKFMHRLLLLTGRTFRKEQVHKVRHLFMLYFTIDLVKHQTNFHINPYQILPSNNRLVQKKVNSQGGIYCPHQDPLSSSQLW